MKERFVPLVFVNDWPEPLRKEVGQVLIEAAKIARLKSSVRYYLASDFTRHESTLASDDSIILYRLGEREELLDASVVPSLKSIITIWPDVSGTTIWTDWFEEGRSPRPDYCIGRERCNTSGNNRKSEVGYAILGALQLLGITGYEPDSPDGQAYTYVATLYGLRRRAQAYKGDRFSLKNGYTEFTGLFGIPESF